MKRPGIDGSFFLCFALNLALNIFWLIPAIVLFILSAVVGIPVWAGWIAVAVWALAVLLATALMSWAASTSKSTPTPTGVAGKTTIRRSSQRANSLEEYAESHQRNTTRR